MTRPGLPANSLPPDFGSFMRRIQDLERQVKMLQGARTLENASIGAGGLTVNGGGNIKINDGGSLTLVAADGTTSVLFVGQANIPDGSGRTQEIVQLVRDDGTPALILGDLGTVPGHAHQQDLAWYDRGANVVVADDTVSGVGLARPHIPTAMVDTNVAHWWSTTAATDTGIAIGYMEYQQPRLQWLIQTYVPAGATGVFTLQLNGTTIGTHTVAGGGSGTFSLWSDVQPVPSGLTYGASYALSLLARVSAGSGTVSAIAYLLQGVGS